MAQWAEDEVVLPNGPFAGEKYRHSRHPASRLWFDAIDSNNWSRFAATGPTQNGKTLMCYVIPVLYHLFEIGETVIVGLPAMEMGNDKWSQDFLPVIEASRYRDLLPTKGEGSKGGMVKQGISFKNGATLRFMSGGGGDKKRAGYTSRVLAVTETDGMDEAGKASREADKIEQLEGRTRAYGRTGKRVYLECTVSVEGGRIWQELKTGTDSRIVRPCPHCGEFVTPEREHLAGWQSAESEEEAAKVAYFVCPSCAKPWTEKERHEAAERAVLIHRGQDIAKDGTITGETPETQTLGFRWSAVDNPFATAGDLGAEEWLARRSRNIDNAEKKLKQFIWVMPYEPPDIEMTPLDAIEVQGRKSATKRGVVPSGCEDIVVSIDTGKRKLHWEAKGILPNGSLPVIDYGTQTVEADKLGTFRGLVEALRKLSKFFETGWSGLRPSQVWIDSGYYEHTDAVYTFCAEMNTGLPPGSERYRPIKGYGEGQQRMSRYLAPTARTRDVAYVGREFHIAKVRRNGRLLPGVLLVHVNADHWKSECHQRLAMPSDQPGAITLFDAADPLEHSEYSMHMTAETQMEKQMPNGRVITVWERIRRENHYLDTAYLSTTAAQFVSDMRTKPAKRAAPHERPTMAQLMGKK